MNRLYLLVAVSVMLVSSLCSCSNKDDSEHLLELDNAIRNNSKYIRQKEHLINELKKDYGSEHDSVRAYQLAMDLYQNYQYFSLDSAFIYLGKAKELAEAMGEAERITNTELSRAFLYNFSGMLSEASDIFEDVDVESLSAELKRNYYYLGFNLYTSLTDNAISAADKKFLRQKLVAYRDSALSCSKNDVVLKAEKMADLGELDKAIEILSKDLPDNITTNEAGLKYFILAEIYGKQNDTENQIKYLSMSSVACINNGVRQYVALRKLAEIMYERGDIDRAYKYIHQCLNDARACNSHSRILETSAILPIIDSAVLHQKQNSRNFLVCTVLVITTLLLALCIMLILLHKKNIALNRSRQEQMDSNSQLKLVNEQLKEANDKLNVLNRDLRQTQKQQENLNLQLSESNKVKTEYITRFMHLCLEYISKMENYRKHLGKVANKKNFEALYETIQSSRYITREVSIFYDNFDEAFCASIPTLSKVSTSSSSPTNG